jgi:hypothetical protein
VVHLSDGMDKLKLEAAITRCFYDGASDEMVLYPGKVLLVVVCR